MQLIYFLLGTAALLAVVSAMYYRFALAANLLQPNGVVSRGYAQTGGVVLVVVLFELAAAALLLAMGVGSS